jgi:hypothetical protein
MNRIPRLLASLATSLLLAIPTLGATAPSLTNAFLQVTVTTNGIAIQPTRPNLNFTAHASLPIPISSATTPSPGSAQITLDNGWSYSLSLPANSPFLHIHLQLSNQTPVPLELDRLQFLQLSIQSTTTADQLHLIGTGGVTPIHSAKGSYTFSALANPKTRHGLVTAWLTQQQGAGIFLPKNTTNLPVTLDARLDFGHLQVNPNQTRPTETLLIGIFPDTRLGLETYADNVASHHNIHLQPTPGVYCTWYHAGASDENQLAANATYAARQLQPFGLSVMQIDDLWQRKTPRSFQGDSSFPTTGPIKLFTESREENYPHGMAFSASNITSHGMTAGIWFMPFAGNLASPLFPHSIYAKNADGSPYHDALWSGTCLDLSNPETQAFILERTQRIYNWGYRYFKIDGMHTGLATKNIYINTHYQDQTLGDAKLHNPRMTHVQAYRKGLQLLRQAAPNTFILGCNVSQNMLSMGPAFGLIDAMRIGPDNGGGARGEWNDVTLGAWHGNNLYFLNKRIWHNDPDPVYVRPSIPLNKARWMCSWLAVSGSMHTSSEQYDALPPERLDLLKRCLPSHTATARPADYLDSDHPRVWVAKNHRLTLLGLFNWNENQPDEIHEPLQRLDLNPDTPHVAFDYWDNQFLPDFTNSLSLQIPAASCRVLAVRPASPHPQLLSTSRHITQGLIDVQSESWNPAIKTLSGSSLVVANDPYELRIALPHTNLWTLKQASAENTPLTQLPDPNGLRLSFTPTTTGLTHWSVQFQ